MRTIVAVGLGTYYKYKSPHAEGASNVLPMQALTWLTKNNRPQAKWASEPIAHPSHPSGKAIRISSPAEAYTYVAEVFSHQEKKVRTALSFGAANIALVPVPASTTTSVTWQSGERWPARSLANELGARGMGTVRVCLVNRKKCAPQTETGSRTPAHEIRANTEVIAQPIAGEAVLFIDDNVTYGVRFAVAHDALAWPGVCGACCVSFTNAKTSVDCYVSRACEIRYDSSRKPWDVTIEPVTRGAK